MSKRSDILEFAILGLLHEGPMHGYVLRKRLSGVLGAGAGLISYGSLYPALKRMVSVGLIAQAQSASELRTTARGKVVYELTAEGKERFQDALADAGPDSWDDERFGVRLAFFGRTDAEVRLRILEGRRSRLEERLSGLRTAVARVSERIDGWSAELHRHGLEGVEREVRWLDELIQGERNSTRTQPGGSRRRGYASDRTVGHDDER
jgi:DNA-binding PadR family transcriptional regulator